jgi:hypothetical protein
MDVKRFLLSDPDAPESRCLFKIQLLWDADLPSDRLGADAIISLHLQALGLIYVHVDYDRQLISFGHEYELKPPKGGLSTLTILALIWGSIGIAIAALCCYQKKKRDTRIRKELVAKYERMRAQ